MSETTQEQTPVSPESLELSRLITEAHAAAVYYGGSSFGAGFSDVAEGAYAAGSIQAIPFESARIFFKAERYRDGVGTPVNTFNYELGLRVSHTFAKYQDPQLWKAVFEAVGISEDNDHHTLQKIVILHYKFDADATFITKHRAYYIADEDTDIPIAFDEYDVPMIVDESDEWYPEESAGQINETPDYALFGGVALLEEGDDSLEIPSVVDPEEFTDELFVAMADNTKLWLHDIDMARKLLGYMRKRHIPMELREALGFSDVYNPKPGPV